jgi:hypothetical protein
MKMIERKPWDLETDHSGTEMLARVLRALITTQSTMTDSFKFSQSYGRGISLFLRVQVPVGKEEILRELLGHGAELKEPPRARV